MRWMAQTPATSVWSRYQNAETNLVRPARILTVVVPTFNEADNVPIIAERVGMALKGTDWELSSSTTTRPTRQHRLRKSSASLTAAFAVFGVWDAAASPERAWKVRLRANRNSSR